MSKEQLAFETRVQALRFAIERNRNNPVGVGLAQLQQQGASTSTVIKEAEEFLKFLTVTVPAEYEKAYTESDLFSFGNYMVSQERVNRYSHHPDYPNDLQLGERLSQVHHADVENWKEENKKIVTEL